MSDAPQGPTPAWYWAITTAETTGKNLTCTIYKSGQTGTAVRTGATVYCEMLAAAAVVPVGCWILVRKRGATWDGLINVYYPEV
jgi:hypothetical protein